MEQLWNYERSLQEQGFRSIAGIDEAGRGPLAGPVVAGACILPIGARIAGLNDSKQLTEVQREELFHVIREKAVAIGIGIVDVDYIDKHNILQATYEAMRRAVRQLKPEPDYLLNDAVTIPLLAIPQMPIVKGDAKSHSIAAASILAKVTRDRLMKEYGEMYPQYGFEKHMGYHTPEHVEALQKYGPCPIHRRSFSPVSVFSGLV
jgi:ribonuclease HII